MNQGGGGLEIWQEMPLKPLPSKRVDLGINSY
jgi:hypothetical protein